MSDWKKNFVYKDGRLINLGDDGIVPDGATVRVPMMMTDGKSKPTDAEVIAAAKAVRDGTVAVDASQQRPRSLSFSDEQNKASAERQAAYDKRIGEAWKQPAPAVTDTSKLTGFVSALGAGSVEAGFKTATMGEPVDLAQARARNDERIRNAWREPA